MKNENIFRLVEWIKESNNIVFFGGAGTSTESGILGFRGTNSITYSKLGLIYRADEIYIMKDIVGSFGC